MESLSLDAFDELVEDLKNLRRELLRGRSFDDVHGDVHNLSKRIDDEAHKATKSILLLKPEKSLTAERVYEKLSLLLADLKQNLITDRGVNEMIRTLDLIVSNMTKLRVLLHKSFESPNPIVKKIMEMTESSRLSPESRTITKTTRIEKKLGYTQSKISSFMGKGDLHGDKDG
ncbi:MAG: hypothetical protein H3Z50_00125 [archaeon]|nr:hypothetical protein [archaeon]MCP8305900.1 hypothetical protein [archaeon]